MHSLDRRHNVLAPCSELLCVFVITGCFSILCPSLSLSHPSSSTSFIHLQKELGDRLLPCFKSTSGIPFSDVNLLTGHAHAPEWGPDSFVSEVGTIQMEFRDLTQLTNDHKYQV